MLINSQIFQTAPDTRQVHMPRSMMLQKRSPARFRYPLALSVASTKKAAPTATMVDIKVMVKATCNIFLSPFS